MDTEDAFALANSVLADAGLRPLASLTADGVERTTHALDVTIEHNASCFFQELLSASSEKIGPSN